MSTEMKRTYVPFKDFPQPSKQTEYTSPTKMFADDGTLLCPGWARRNVFEYDRDKSQPKLRKKEWDFYQVSNGEYMVQLSFANISIGGYVSATLVDLKNPDKSKKLAQGQVATQMAIFLGGSDKYVLPPKGDVPNNVKFAFGGAEFEFDTKETSRTLYFKMKDVECNFQMDIPKGLENITTVLPFKDNPTRYFMTTKQNCMPCEGTYKYGDKMVTFSKEDSFGYLDWGRVNTPYQLVWYWGNGSTYVKDAKGKKHTFGFEITWGIGDESNATETCLFYDGKAHKIDAVDVEVFPKPDKFMDEWKFVSEDGRFNMVMKPFYDHYTDLNVYVLRMLAHQVHGLWSGTVVLDDGTKLEIKDMYAFCEYVENRW